MAATSAQRARVVREWQGPPGQGQSVGACRGRSDGSSLARVSMANKTHALTALRTRDAHEGGWDPRLVGPSSVWPSSPQHPPFKQHLQPTVNTPDCCRDHPNCLTKPLLYGLCDMVSECCIRGS